MSTAYHTHPDYLAHLAGIRAVPADDLRRLVLADWLDENGFGERSALIRLMVTNQSGAAPLVDVCWPSFCHLSHWDAHRGFIQAVRCTFAEWAELAPAIMPESVGLRVRLTNRPLLGRDGVFDTPTITRSLTERWPEVAHWEMPEDGPATWPMMAPDYREMFAAAREAGERAALDLNRVFWDEFTGVQS